MVDVARLTFEFDATSATAAEQKIASLEKASGRLDQAAARTKAAFSGGAFEQMRSSAGAYEQSLKSLVTVYGQVRDAAGRFTSVDGAFRHSQEATALMAIRNAQAQAALAKEHERAAAVTASYATKIDRLRASLDPFAAIQTTLVQRTKLLDDAMAHGAISADQHAQALSQVTRQALAEVQTLDRLQKAHGTAGEAAKLQSYQLLNLGRQGADVFVSLASGQAIWMVAIQQGAQIGEIFADAATQGVGLKAALAGIAAQVGPMLAIGAPLIAIGGAIAAAAIAFNQGDKEAAKLANTLALAGSNAGITAVQFEQFARQVGSETKAGTDEARKALLGLTETGKFSGQTIKVLGEDVVQFSRLTGKSTQEAVAYFSQMGAGVADFAAKFGQAYGGITLAQIEHIQLLERQGATTQAQLEASIMIHDRLGKAGPVNLGYLEQAWRGVSTAIKEAWTWLKTWGNESAGRANAMQNIQDQIRLNNERLQGNPTNGNGRSFLDEERRQLEARNKGLQSQLTALKAVEAAEQKRVQAEATANQVQADGIAAANEHAGSWAKIARNVSLATQEIERYRKGQADIRAANPNSKELDSPTQAAAIEAGIRKRYEHLTKQPAVSAATRADARGDNAVEQAQAAELAARRGLTKNIEEVARIRGEEIAQELQTQRVRLEGQVRTKQITDADAKTAIASYERAAASKKAAVDQQLFSDQVARQRALEDTIAGYTDRQAQSQVALASSLEQAQAIENKALADRQQRAAGRRDFDLFMEWADGKKTEAEVQQVQAAASGADAADREVKARNDRLAIFQRDTELRQSALQNTIDIAQSEMGLARSAGQRQEIEDRIAKARYDYEVASVQQAIQATNDVSKKAELADKLKAMGVVYDNERKAANSVERAYYDMEGTLRSAAQAIESRDWVTATAKLYDAFDTLRKALEGSALNAKIGALGGVAAVAGSVVGGKGGSVIGGIGAGAAAGAQLGSIVPGIGTAIGAGVGALIGGIGSLFGGGSSKKKAREQEAAQRAAEEAQRQATIADTGRSLEIALLRAQGQELAAVAKEREGELAKLTALSPALAAQQQALYDAIDAADKKAKADALAADQRGLDIQLLEAQGKAEEALAMKRADQIAALDPSLRATQQAIFAEQDLTKARDAATKAADEAAQQAIANQATNIGLMRQLQAMDDAVLGTTVARDAQRADELAKLDQTGRYLQGLIYARQDEADAIAKQKAATEAATAAAEEAARKAAEILKQRTDLEDQLLGAMGRGAEATARQRAAILKGLDPSLVGLQQAAFGLEDANAAVAAAESAVADARNAASQAYEREISAIQATNDKFKSFSDSLRSFRLSLDTGGLAMNDPMQQYSRTKADFEKVAGLASQGNEEAIGSLQGVSEAYLEAAKNAQATNVGYFRDLSAVKRATEASQKYADKQVDQGSAQLAALNAQVSGLGILNQSTLSVGQAVTNVAAAIEALAKATASKDAAMAAAGGLLNNGERYSVTGNKSSADYAVAYKDTDSADVKAAKLFYNLQLGVGTKDDFYKYFGGDDPQLIQAWREKLNYTGFSDAEELRKRYGFDTGGSFTVGGSGGPDSQFVPLHLSPGEVGNITRPDVMAALLSEMRGLRQDNADLRREVSDLKAHTKRGADAAEDSATVLEGAARGQLTISTEAA